MARWSGYGSRYGAGPLYSAPALSDELVLRSILRVGSGAVLWSDQLCLFKITGMDIYIELGTWTIF